MKVYVDELPKSCADCYCCNNDYEKGYCCNLGYFNEETCDYSLVSKQRCTDCPLKSLADHDKQVKKKTIDDLAVSLISSFSKDAEFTVEEICNWLQKVKDQIQGETK